MERAGQDPRRPTPRRADERGAALVEFALVFPLMMMLLLGIISGGLAFDRGQSLTHAAREASRFGATLPVPASGTTTWLDQVATAAKANADENLAANAPGQELCVALVRSSGTVRRLETAGVTYYDNAPCFADGLSSDRVQVGARRQATFEVLVFSQVLDLHKRASARFEAQ